MTDKDFQKVDEKFAATAYVILGLSIFIAIDYNNLRLDNDLSEFGHTWTPIIIFSGFAVFAVLQSLRVVAYYRRYGRGR